jgi:hypothetical protein
MLVIEKYAYLVSTGSAHVRRFEPGPRHCGAQVTRAVDAGGAMDAENAPTALSSGDDFENGQKTPCLRTARTYAILTAPVAGWFSNVR